MGAVPVLFCSHVAEWGGAETVLADLLGALDRRAITPHLALPGPGPLAERAAALGVPVHPVPFGSGRPWRKAAAVPGAARALRRLAAAIGSPVLYANSVIAGYAAVLAQRPGLGGLFHLHVVPQHPLLRFAARRATAVVLPSAAAANALGSGLGGRVHVVPNGVAERFFAAAAAPRGPAERAARGLPPDGPLLGILGRLDPQKGHAVLLRALRELPGVQLAVVGGEVFTAQQQHIAGTGAALRALAGELGLGDRVHWLGPRDDVAALLPLLDAVVLPSTGLESAPRALAEAMAAGVPVVASAIGGVPELVDDGHSGRLVPPGDAGALAQALRGLLADPARAAAMAAAGRRAALERFTLDGFAARIAAVIASVAGGPR